MEVRRDEPGRLAGIGGSDREPAVGALAAGLAEGNHPVDRWHRQLVLGWSWSSLKVEPGVEVDREAIAGLDGEQLQRAALVE